MAIGDDFNISSAGAITHVSGSTNYTVLELHRWLQDLADDAEASSTDLVDITTSTPSERSTDNIITLNSPFNIDDTAAQFLYDGSISQLGGATVYSGLVVVGSVVASTELQVWQDEATLTSFWSTGINADAGASILSRMLIKTVDNGAAIDGQRIIVYAREFNDTYAEFSVTMGLGNNTAAIFTADDLNNDTAAATVATWTEITNTEGYQLLDIAGDGAADEPYYSQWDYGVRTASNVYERTKWIQRRGTAETIHSMGGELFRGITHQFPFDTQTTNFVEDNIVAWGTDIAYDTGTGTVPAVGQYWQNTTQGDYAKVVWVASTAGATGTAMFQKQDVTTTWADGDSFTLLGGTGTFDINVTVNGNTNVGGSGVILAVDDDGATGTVWMQLISGGAPANNYDLRERTVDATDKGLLSGAATARTVSPEFVGTYTGSSFIGAFGIGIAPADGIAADLFTTLVGGNVNPPNNQDFTVFGLISGDRVLVANNSGGAPDFAQFTIDATYATSGITSIQVSPNLPADTPQTGTFRIELDTGIYRRLAYTAHDGTDIFTIGSTDFTDPLDATIGNNLFLSYIDLATATTQEAVTLAYSGDRTMFVRVRDGGASPIKTFETTSVFGTGGGSATATRTTDA